MFFRRGPLCVVRCRLGMTAGPGADVAPAARLATAAADGRRRALSHRAASTSTARFVGSLSLFDSPTENEDLDGPRWRVLSWGRDEAGRLGLGWRAGEGRSFLQPSPAEVEGLPPAPGPPRTPCHSALDAALARRRRERASGWFQSGGGHEPGTAAAVARPGAAGAPPQVACGYGHTIALTGGGAVYTWGRGSAGRLGTGDEDGEDESDRPSPQLCVDADEAVSVSAGGLHSAAVRVDGTALVWGFAGLGALGLGEGRRVDGGGRAGPARRPRRLPGPWEADGRRVTEVVCGPAHTMVGVDGGERDGRGPRCARHTDRFPLGV